MESLLKYCRLVHHFLEQSAESFPESIGAIHEKKRASFRDINKLANKLAHDLIQAGIKPGDRIVLICENNIEYIFSYYGILKAGGIAVAFNTEIKPENMEELLEELKPNALIISAKHEHLGKTLKLAQFGIRRLYVANPRSMGLSGGLRVSSLYEGLSANSDANPELNIDPKSCAMIVYTSGSAGKPKGVMLTHSNIVANTGSIIDYLKLTRHDTQMVVLPFFYVMGKSLLNTHFAVGGKVVINNKFGYTASVLKQMAEEKVTGFSGVPSTYAHLLFRSPLAEYRDRLPALRYCSQAGGHMPKHVKLELLKALPPHTQLFVMYGATEASARLTYVPPEVLRAKIDSIGKPISGVEIDILSAEGIALKPGEIGEIVARGDNIMAGYYRDAESTKKVLDEHGYHTGDLGYHDEEGFFYVTGRKDNQLKVGGHRINPQEIEDVVVESGHVVECIIFGIPDPLLGHRLAGLVVPIRQSPDTIGNILKYCGAKLPKYKIPESLFLAEAIPKNSSGKPDRPKSIRLFDNLKTKKGS